MIKRPYYDDPLMAAIAVRDFGIQLLARHTDAQMLEYDISEEERFYDWHNGCVVDGPASYETIGDALKFITDATSKVYVKDGCVHIFRPMYGDILELNGSVFTYSNQNIEPAKIIMRQGKFFPWPEWEM